MVLRADKGRNESPPTEDSSSIDTLFRAHNESLVRFLRARLASEADAREAAQEAYVRLLQLDQTNQPSFLRAYLFKVAANVATDMLRQRASRKTFLRAEPPEQPIPATQERALQARQHLAVIDRAVHSLPAKCQEAFRLSRDENCAPSEIAERLGVSDRMVRNYLKRALEHIHHSIDATLIGSPR